MLFSIILVTFSLLAPCIGFLDIEELQSMKYGIDILDKPVMTGQEETEGAIYLKTKFGQSYQCTYPNTREEERRENEEEKLAIETGVADLLIPMEATACLTHTKGWWTYEVCPKKHIKQYHAEDGKPSGKIISLGDYEGEFDWSNYTKPKSLGGKRRVGRTYHSQYYTNGSLCELTGGLRKTEVKFSCKDNQPNTMFSVDEPETCVYVINVQTHLLCRHPDLKPMIPTRPSPITCNPLLSQEDYHDYMEEQNAREEARQEAIRNAKDRYKDKYNQQDDSAEPKTRDEDTDDSNTADAFVESLLKSLKEAFGDVEPGNLKMGSKSTASSHESLDETQSDLTSEIPVSADDLEDADEGMTVVRDNYVIGDEDGEATVDGETDSSISEAGSASPDEDEEDEDAIILEEFDKGLNEIKANGESPSHLGSHRDSIESSIKAQFEDIVEEAQGELENEGFDGEIDKDLAFKQLAKTLGKLLQRLDSTEKEIQNMDKELEESMSQDEETEDTSGGLSDEDDEDDDEDADDSHLIPVGDVEGQEENHRTSVSVDSPLSEEHAAPPDDSSPLHTSQNPKADTSQPHKPSVNKVKVTVNHQEFKQSSTEQKLAKSDDATKRKMAETLKEKIEQTGIDTTGRKVEVKIVTEFFDGTGSGDLFGEETHNKVVIAVLAGNDEEIREQQHHHQMEKAYNFEWQNKKSKQKPLSIH